MERLAKRIASDLAKEQISAIYNSELARLWPASMDVKERERRIRQFAKRHGFVVDVYRVGLCAIFQTGNRKKSKRLPSAYLSAGANRRPGVRLHSR